MTVDVDHEMAAELLGAYALDALDRDEAAGVEAHLAGCPRCRAEVREHRTVVGLFSYSGAEAPRDVWDRITLITSAPPPRRSRRYFGLRSGLAASEHQRRTRPVDRAPERNPSPRRAVFTTLGALAAALVLLVALQARPFDRRPSGGQRPGSPAPLQVNSAVVAAAVGSPGARLVRLASSGSGRPSAPSGVTAVLLADGTGYVLGDRLKPLPAGETNQLWGQIGNEMVSYGLLGAEPGTFAFRSGRNPSRLAISAEQAGGVAVSHNVAVLSGTVSTA